MRSIELELFSSTAANTVTLVRILPFFVMRYGPCLGKEKSEEYIGNFWNEWREFELTYGNADT